MLEQIFFGIAARHAAVCLALLPGCPVLGRHRLNGTFDFRSSVDFRFAAVHFGQDQQLAALAAWQVSAS
jgi:hypothetical protein